MVMNPLEKECFGHYGYGTGFFFLETSKRAGQSSAENREVAAFCNVCSACIECWAKHKEIIDQEHPLESAAFIAAVDQAIADGQPNAGGELAMRAVKAGTPDPWMNAMFTNIKRGFKDSTGLDIMEIDGAIKDDSE